jgi:hypothetical protein
VRFVGTSDERKHRPPRRPIADDEQHRPGLVDPHVARMPGTHHVAIRTAETAAALTSTPHERSLPRPEQRDAEPPAQAQLRDHRHDAALDRREIDPRAAQGTNARSVPRRGWS